MRKVVEYLEGRSSNFFGTDMAKHNLGKTVLAPLLSVSERWCAVALESICDYCLVKFDYASGALAIIYPAWPTYIPYRRVQKNHLVKWVIVSVPLWKEMCDGSFCKVIARPEYEGVVFLSATTLELRLDNDTMQSTTSASSSSLAFMPVPVITREQAVDFARSVRSLTPAVTGITIGYEFISDSSANVND
ncbi:hypothetical protein GGI21_006439, partial [Coemansia aciculifera]